MERMTERVKIRPVLLCGGTGSRLWPLSREGYPKQFLALGSERSLLQDTALRVADPERFAAPIIVCNYEHRFLVAEQLRACDVQPAAILLEPEGRNTAPAVALAALTALSLDGPDGVMLVLPSDHIIADTDAFAEAVAAAAAIGSGHLVTFGIAPASPETGYGYIRVGEPLEGAENAYRVRAFVEKPARALAERYLAEGGYLWNGGLFLFGVGTILAELERHAPDVRAAAGRALSRSASDLGFRIVDRAAFAEAPPVSIDVAVMERTERAVVVSTAFGWSDVGVWSALWDIGAKDARGNVARGDALFEDAQDCYVRSDGHLTAVVGLSGAVVVATDDAVLVAARDRVQDVKAVVERLRRAKRPEALLHRTVHRPWGNYRRLHIEDRVQVKCIVVAPGGRLSLQKHHHRAEHWVVVKGTARVTRGEEEVLVYENQSIYIPIGAVHRLENPGNIPLHVIEVQSGSYLGEDDIVRFDDVYGRGETKPV
jgi:mannose-1-phosphate guanylyltransferase / mannose-6-phosphate isomerase